MLIVSVPSGELTLPLKFPSIRRDVLKVTSPENFTTSPTKPSQLSLGILIPGAGILIPGPRSLILATACILTGSFLCLWLMTLLTVATLGRTLCSAALELRGELLIGRHYNIGKISKHYDFIAVRKQLTFTRNAQIRGERIGPAG